MSQEFTESIPGDDRAQLLALRVVVERVSDAFVALNRKWHYTYVNAQAAQLLGK